MNQEQSYECLYLYKKLSKPLWIAIAWALWRNDCKIIVHLSKCSRHFRFSFMKIWCLKLFYRACAKYCFGFYIFNLRKYWFVQGRYLYNIWSISYTKPKHSIRYSYRTKLKTYDAQVSIFLLSVLYFYFKCHNALFLNEIISRINRFLWTQFFSFSRLAPYRIAPLILWTNLRHKARISCTYIFYACLSAYQSAFHLSLP